MGGGNASMGLGLADVATSDALYKFPHFFVRFQALRTANSLSFFSCPSLPPPSPPTGGEGANTDLAASSNKGCTVTREGLARIPDALWPWDSPVLDFEVKNLARNKRVPTPSRPRAIFVGRRGHIGLLAPFPPGGAERCGSRCACAHLDSAKKASLWLACGLQGGRWG